LIFCRAKDRIIEKVVIERLPNMREIQGPKRWEEERILEKGDKIRIKPLCGHIFNGLEDTLFVEYSPQFYEDEDIYKVDLGPGGATLSS